MSRLLQVLERGGPALWVIGVLSVATLALILLRIWRLWRAGAWQRGATEAALALWSQGSGRAAMDRLAQGRSFRVRFAHAAMAALLSRPEPEAREEAARIARALMAEARQGLRALDLVVMIAPLIGLLGTVLGMIEAFQALQESGSQADPTALAGGIWEALLTTAAGMAVAIPAAMALSWFESIAEALALDLEDIATRLFLGPIGKSPSATASAAQPGDDGADQATPTGHAPAPASGPLSR